MSPSRKKHDILEYLMQELGDFRPYQNWQYVLQGWPTVVAGVQMYSLLTVAAVPEHRCKIPNIDINNTMTYLNLTDLSKYIPLKSENTIDQCSILDPSTNESVKCSSWVYSTQYHTSSRAIEWNFVCDRRWMSAVSQTTFMLGILFGNLLFGHLADKAGRKPVFCCTAIISLIVGVGVAFTTQYYTFLIMRFILGMVACAGSNIAGFILTMELTSPSRRTALGVIQQTLFASGIMLVPLWGSIIKDRKLLQIIYGLHALPLLFHWWLLDESPRWLWAKGRYRESLQIVEKALRFNGSKKTLNIDELIPVNTEVTDNDKEINVSLIDLFRRPNLRKRILNVGFCWFGNSLVYYGLSFSTESMKGNPFIVIFLMALLELPGYILILLLLDKLGRRFLTSFNMITSGICCVLVAYMTVGTLTSNIFAYSGKFLISVSFAVIYIYSAELFPTMTRNSAIGFACMCARISGSLAPLIFLLDSFDPRIPSTAFGLITILSGFLTFYLPETRGTRMPASLEEGEAFGEGDTCFTNLLAKKQVSSYTKEVVDHEQLEPLNNSNKV